ncbi:MAG TPA: hypothetical protein VLK65_29760 [Vicinamibacteria bacterium]|nr:hypothetical protein [Vicinamibacteria bacterium]
MMVRTLPCMVTLLLASCAPREGVPIFEEPTAVALQPLATAVLNDVRAARASMAVLDRDRHLQHAEASLERLNEYYLPLLDAKDRAYQACRLYYADPGSVGRELEEIEKLLTSIITARGRRVEASMEPAFELLTEARVSMDAGSSAAPKHLHDLARRLSYMLLKGELIL